MCSNTKNVQKTTESKKYTKLPEGSTIFSPKIMDAFLDFQKIFEISNFDALSTSGETKIDSSHGFIGVPFIIYF